MSLSGLSEYGAEQALSTANVLPSGTAKYIALLTTIPTSRDGTGLVEASGSGYARLSHNAWVTVQSGGYTYRKNSGAATFAALTDDLEGIVGWAVYSAVSGGNLIAFGPLVDGSNNEVTQDFVSGDQPRFADQELEVRVGAA